MSYYDTLGVKATATKDEIKTAYRRLAKKYHPDMPTGNEKKFIEVTKAYEGLMNDQTGEQAYPFGNQSNYGPQQQAPPRGPFGGFSGFEGFEDFIRQQRAREEQAQRARYGRWEYGPGTSPPPPPPGFDGMWEDLWGEAKEEKINGDGIRTILVEDIDKRQGVPSMFSWKCDGCGDTQKPSTLMYYMVGGKRKVCRSCKKKIVQFLQDDDNFDY